MASGSDIAAKPEQPAWHAIPAEEALATLASDRAIGLTEPEAHRRRARFGPNRISQGRRRSAIRRFAAQFNNLFILLLIVAAVITGLLGERLDSVVIFGVVVLIGIIGFVQEGRAEPALESVRSILPSNAVVRRDGCRRQIPAEALVPGDIVLLEPGDRVPADIRLLETRNLQTLEAGLTGESAPVAKSTDPAEAAAEVGDRTCLAFSGTTVAAGHAAGLVIATGEATEIGRISGLLAEVEVLRTPLMQRLDAFTRTLGFVILALAAVTFAIGTFVWDRAWPEMFLAAVSVAVAAIPEGLPAVMTVTLAIDVERMARRNAIIRRLPAVEALGSVTTICADKTGTLTRNEMMVRTIRTAESMLTVEGTGYAPHGAFLRAGQAVVPAEVPEFDLLMRAMLLCNEAAIIMTPEAGWRRATRPKPPLSRWRGRAVMTARRTRSGIPASR